MLLIQAHTSAIAALAYTPDSRALVTAGSDGTAHLWSLPSGERVHRFTTGAGTSTSYLHPAQNAIKCCLVVFPDNKTLLTGGVCGTLNFWDLVSGQRRSSKGLFTPLTAVACSPEGGAFVVGEFSGSCRLFEVTEPLANAWFTITGHRRQINTIAFAQSGRVFATGSDDRSVVVWDTWGRRKKALPQAAEVRAVAFTPDARDLVIAGKGGMLLLVDRSSDKVRRTFVGHGGDVNAVAVSPDGRVLASVGFDGFVHLWDLATGGNFANVHWHAGPLSVVAFSPDGMTAASGGQDGTVAVWDADSL